MGITANDASTLKSNEATTSNQSEPTALASPSPETVVLPAQPLVTIEPSGRWGVFNLRDLWSYRELLYFLIWRDVKVRYKQTALGVAWAIIQPLFTMLIFSLFFGRLANVPSDGVPYPLFAYAGLLPWTFFANAVSNSGNSLVGSANLITKVYFPRMIIPAAAVGAGLVDLGISFVVLVPLMFYYGVTLTWNVLMLPVFVVLTALLALGVGMWLSALNVKYRDVRFALPFLVQLWMFISPVIYPTSFLPQKYRLLFALNPMTGVIEGYRSALFGHAFNWKALAVATSLTLAVLVYASFSFRRMEKSFADIV
ncbi:MAG TPA: ABC transporter permease [Pyrinomonadaceae bacterium]